MSAPDSSPETASFSLLRKGRLHMWHISERGIPLEQPTGQIDGMPKPANTRDRTTNWKSYNEALKRRGSLSVWFDPDMSWQAERTGKPGHPPVFSNTAIQFSLMVKVLFGLPLRQTTGMVSSILEMAG